MLDQIGQWVVANVALTILGVFAVLVAIAGLLALLKDEEGRALLVRLGGNLAEALVNWLIRYLRPEQLQRVNTRLSFRQEQVKAARRAAFREQQSR